MHRALRLRSVLVAAILATACAAPGAPPDGEGPTMLSNSGKADGARLRVRLSEASPATFLGVYCDNELGCEGYVTVRVTSPDACTLLDDPRCGVTRMDPTSVPVAEVVLRSVSEGERRLPLEVHTGDGDFIETSVSAAFYAGSAEEVEIEVVKAEGAPDVALEVEATWEDALPPDVQALEDYLSSVPGLSWSETATAYPGYRAYALYLEQPLDHDDPMAGVFFQEAVLHHIDQDAPMVLFTSGYDLTQRNGEFLSELTEGLDANQLDTEQRFFGTSFPADTSPEAYRHVSIRQAAADHHRFVEVLRPFYAGSWIGTGHSKGGMTSVYHRRFYPEDTDLTVAYVAPISHGQRDERYVPFLDAIGTEECRARVRGFQRGVLSRIDEITPSLEAESAVAGLSYTFYGSFEAAFESSIESYEWGFWQAYGLGSCGEIPDQAEVEALPVQDLLQLARSQFGYGLADSSLNYNDTYNYQAAEELGFPLQTSGHLADIERHPEHLWWVPAGTMPVHRPEVMQDIQSWVHMEGRQLIFVYGEYDPWTGGAFEVPDVEDVVSVTAPQATHAAMIRDLEPEDRDRVLDAIETWIGARPEIGPTMMPSRAPTPPGLRYEGL